MFEYLSKSFSVWFLGFFPLAEIYVAVPAGLALNLDAVSVLFWAIFGNILPVVLIHYGYNQLRRWDRLARYLDRLTTEKVRARMNRWGIWAVLLLTPWTGVWAMAVTAKALGMDGRLLIGAALVSVTVYAIAIVLTINAGVDAFGN